MRLSTTHRFERVFLEIGNVCNLQCTFCPEVERNKAALGHEQMRALLSEVKEFASQVCFHVMGEPLAHQHFTDFVAMAGELGVPVEITTNGTLLSPEKEAALLHHTIRQVNFSLQSFFDNFPSADPETYLRRIFDFTKRAMRERPDLYINYRLWNLTEAGEDQTNSRLLDRLEKEFSVEINRRVDARVGKSKRLVDRLYLHYDTRFEWPHPSQPLLREKGSCYGTRSHVAVHADGTVVPCCLDKEARIPLGNVFQQSFSSIVSGERLEKIRQGFEKGELIEDLCRRCSYATRFQ